MHAGFKKLEVTDDEKNISFPIFVTYPTDVPSTTTRIRSYSIEASPEPPIKKGAYPLVIISHGGGGNYLGYLTLSQYLAKHGYIVASLEHYKNNRSNNALSHTKENLENRPRHVGLTIDAIACDPFFKSSMLKDNVAVIGHSLGGYTALAIAGGKPLNQDREEIAVTPHPGVKAIILLAPATLFFSPKGALDDVNIPLYLITAEKDNLTPSDHTEVIFKNLPNKEMLLFEEIKNAGHFSFLSPFPPALRNAKIIPSQDPKGFDRDAFHQDLNKKIDVFLSDVFKGVKPT